MMMEKYIKWSEEGDLFVADLSKAIKPTKKQAPISLQELSID